MADSLLDERVDGGVLLTSPPLADGHHVEPAVKVHICNICHQKSDHAKLKISHNELPWLQVVNEIGCSKTNVKEVGCSGWSQVKNIHLKIDSNSKRKISIKIREVY